MLGFYIQVVNALEAIGASYVIVGAFAGMEFGITRVTQDVDILVDIHPADADALAARFPPPRYYADAEMMRDSMARGMMFNIIDMTAGIKADLVPLSREPECEVAFTRRIRRTFRDDDGNLFDAWCAQPTDIIIGKLRAWTEGRSFKHYSDIFEMLVFALRGLSDEPIDVNEISREAEVIGDETLTFWLELVATAQAEVQKNRTA